MSRTQATPSSKTPSSPKRPGRKPKPKKVSGLTPRAGKNLLEWCRENGEYGKRVEQEWGAGNDPADMRKWSAGSNLKAHWVCVKDPSHKWEAVVDSRTRKGCRCPLCSSQKVDSSNSLKTLCEQTGQEYLIQEFHPTKNLPHTPDTLGYGAHKKIHWVCSKDSSHEWETRIAHRTRLGSGCPFCRGLKIVSSNSFRVLCEQNNQGHLIQEFHSTKNFPNTPDTLSYGAHKKIHWVCSKDSSHEWETMAESRTRGGSGCPWCSGHASRWTKDRIIDFIRGLAPNLASMTPVELQVVLAQSGQLEKNRTYAAFGKFLREGKIRLSEIATALDSHKPDEQIFDALLQKGEEREQAEQRGSITDPFQPQGPDGATAKVPSDESHQGLPPVPSPKDILNTAQVLCMSVSSDEETVDYLIQSATEKLWAQAYEDQAKVIAQVRAEKIAKNETYKLEARDRFLKEFKETVGFPIPDGYAFKREGVRQKPKLMQLRLAAQIKTKRRVGNWSGTGAGKTLSGVLASRVIDAKISVIFCPNSVIQGWKDTIENAFPNSEVLTSTMTPTWQSGSKTPKYLVLNYDKLQQPGSEGLILDLAELSVDFVILDEVHSAKQREGVAQSKRSKLLAGFLTKLTRKNPDLAVLGLTATPVINDLTEFKSLLELIQGIEYTDLNTEKTLENAVNLHKQLVRSGIRWMPKYDSLAKLEEHTIKLDWEEAKADYANLVRSELGVESLLTKTKIPAILKYLRKLKKQGPVRVLLYTYYVGEGILEDLQGAIEKAGFKVGLFTQGAKDGLQDFKDGKLQVLIGSRVVGTGVDGLQDVCRHLIINSLPWTNAEYEQLLGRLVRTGQKNHVEVFLPLVSTFQDGEERSACRYRWARILEKKSLGDAVSDGILTNAKEVDYKRVAKELWKWLDRVKSGEGHQAIERKPLEVELRATPGAKTRKGHSVSPSQVARDLGTWRSARSSVTHRKLQANPERWYEFHRVTEASKNGREGGNPLLEIQKNLLKFKKPMVVADLGCGMAKLAEGLKGKHTVLSFDHVAVHDGVVACDIAKLPLEDDSVDCVVVCLALWGTNWEDTLRQAHRILTHGGRLRLAEIVDKEGLTTPSRIPVADLKDKLSEVGFRRVTHKEDRGFVFVDADKED